MSKTKYILTAILVFAVLLFAFTSANAQCSVCRASAESNVEHGYTVGRGLNTGILYLLSIPYVLGGVAFTIWYKNKKK